jgi:hypothetical protein
MNLCLVRSEYGQFGIFGKLMSQDKSCQVAVTLEHAYSSSASGPITYIPKLPPGEYVCVKGIHQLAHMRAPFETFEITDVPGHFGILFHVGNDNEDSAGCVLLGRSRAVNRIEYSRGTFERFLQLQKSVDQFTLTVE